MADTTDILLCGKSPVYELIEKMIAAASSPFRSKRIHIGCDDAKGIGTGKHLKLSQQYNSPTDIFVKHVSQVIAICQKYGLKPLMWSDMVVARKPDEKIESVVENFMATNKVDLVYWDYYNVDVKTYSVRLKKHLEAVVVCSDIGRTDQNRLRRTITM